MELIVIPQALLLFYGALVLGCGAGLGVIAGRNIRGKKKDSDPTDGVERRLTILEQELQLAQSEIAQLGEENRFLRELSDPTKRALDRERRLGITAA